MSMRRVLSALVLAALALPAGRAGAQAQQQGTITGRVTDATTSQPTPESVLRARQSSSVGSSPPPRRPIRFSSGDGSDQTGPVRAVVRSRVSS